MPTVPGLRRMIVADLPAAFELRAATRENRITLERLETDYGITIDGLAEAMRSDVAGWLVEKDGRVAAFAMGDRSNGEVQVVAVLPTTKGTATARPSCPPSSPGSLRRGTPRPGYTPIAIRPFAPAGSTGRSAGRRPGRSGVPKRFSASSEANRQAEPGAGSDKGQIFRRPQAPALNRQ